MSKPRDHLHVSPLEGFEPEIGRVLWMLEDTRKATGRILEGIAPEIIDWQPPIGNSIGTLLYHIALIEMDWLYNEVMEGHLPELLWEGFPYPVRDANDRLTVVTGVSLDAHYKRLDATRSVLFNAFKHMTLADFRQPRSVERYDVTPEWVLHHLIQHEAEHRGEMATIRALGNVRLA